MAATLFKLMAVLAITLASTAATYPQGLPIHTIAGNVIAGATNGFGSNARFNHPIGLAADAQGNIYVADAENSTIRRISPNGYADTIAGLPGNFGIADGPGSSARFYGPQSVAADNVGQLYLADTANNTIRKVSLDGSVTTFAGTPGNSNSFDGAGGDAQFFHPEGLAVDPGGNLYVADTWNHTVRKITLSGKVTTIAGLPGAWGSADGTNQAARFYLPQGIGISATGDILVADSGNQTLRKISLAGTNWVVSTIAGSAGVAGSSNGMGNSAQFYFPAAVTVDSAGYLYVSDLGNNMIRTTRIVPPTLQFTALGDQLILSWPISADGFVLEESAALAAAAAWSAVTNGIMTLTDNFVRTNASTGPAYYRLHLP